MTVGLRGLGAARTLVLIDGRRIGPAGVEGAPTSPDLGLVPSSLVAQYDELLDGASSIYGSDAVAGVVNILLRKDFNGLEVDVNPLFPSHSGGDRNQVSAAWGMNFDRGFIGAGAEYYDADPVTLQDRPWTRDCNRHVEVDEAGRRRYQDQYYTTVLGMAWDGCRLGSLAGRVSVPTAGSIYFTPGYSNGGWPDFSESSSYQFGVDGDGDGRTDVSFRDYDLNGREQFRHLYADVRTINAMAYGEYTFEGDMNLAPFFELLWAQDDFFSNSGALQLFPRVPELNPFNICNPLGSGVDCGLAMDALRTNPNYVAPIRQLLGRLLRRPRHPARRLRAGHLRLAERPHRPRHLAADRVRARRPQHGGSGAHADPLHGGHPRRSADAELRLARQLDLRSLRRALGRRRHGAAGRRARRPAGAGPRLLLRHAYALRGRRFRSFGVEAPQRGQRAAGQRCGSGLRAGEHVRAVSVPPDHRRLPPPRRSATTCSAIATSPRRPSRPCSATT